MLFHFGRIPGKCTVCILSTVLNKQTIEYIVWNEYIEYNMIHNLKSVGE
jgi:hypothetical protein